MNPPRKRLKVTIVLEAHDWDHVGQIMDQVSRDFALEYCRGGCVSGGGWHVTVDEDPSAPDRGEYDQQLRAWSTWHREQRRGGQP